MARIYPEFESLRATRQETLRLVADLDPQISDQRPKRDVWSVGEVLDHLVKTDAVMMRELEVAIERGHLGFPLVYRGVSDIEPSVPGVLKPVLPFFEIPFGIANATVPPPVRRFFTGNRRVPARAPKLLRPRRGRSFSLLQQELQDNVAEMAAQQKKYPRLNLASLYYYNLIVGLSTVTGIYKFIANHEKRHQKQLADILQLLSIPETASHNNADTAPGVARAS